MVGPWEQARVTAGIDGRFTVALGVSSLGQGLRTALGQLAAELLEVPFERIVIECALARSGGRRRDASVLLGWGRNTLTRKIQELGMDDL